jgi:hypothetical protein
LLQADGGSVTIALTWQNSTKQNTGLLKEAEKLQKQFDCYFEFSGL